MPLTASLQVHTEWQFGGLLAHLPSGLAWAILIGAGLAGVFLIRALYSRTLRELPPMRRRLLCTLRGAALILFLLCLANPSRVMRTPPDTEKKQLAILVDASASMTTPDSRNQTRIRNALATWEMHSDAAAKTFDNLEFFRFDKGVESAKGMEEALAIKEPGSQTQLYSAIQSLAKSGRASGVVCLTDGLDTSGASPDEAIQAAQRNGVPVYFVPGRNRAKPPRMVRVEELRVPSRALRNTLMDINSVVEIVSPAARDIPLSLWSGERKLAENIVSTHAGVNTVQWPTQISAGEPGLLSVELRAGQGPEQESVHCSTRVVEKTTVDILYYQGAPRWGYRFLLSTLQSDPSFRLTSILKLTGEHAVTASGDPQQILNTLPESAGELKRFQIILLAHVTADDLTVAQQAALADYVKAGGSVLFVTPDTESTSTFSGAPIEQILPVVFEPPGKPAGEDPFLNTFQRQMRSIGGSAASVESGFANRLRRLQVIPQLVSFTIPKGIEASTQLANLDRNGVGLPMFNGYARVQSLKAGAEVLAAHPSATMADGIAPAILMARQRFGEGSSVVMGTDLLWRWKMSLPSDSRVVERFWQELLLSLAPLPGEGLRVVKQTASPAVDRAVDFRIEAPRDGGTPLVNVKSPTGEVSALALQETKTERGRAWTCTILPKAPGLWTVEANEPELGKAAVSTQIQKTAVTAETVNTPADIDGMRRIAEATGGQVLDEYPVFQRDNSFRLERPKGIQPLWNSSILLVMLLGVYGAELIYRRTLKLL